MTTDTNAESTSMFLNDVLLARAWLTKPFQPKPQKDGKIPDAKYRIEVVIPMDHPQLAEIKQKQRAAAVKKWGSDAQQQLLIAETKDRLVLHKGDITRAGQEEYKGALYLTAMNKIQPTLVVTENGVNIATQGTPTILTPSHEKYPYAGSRVNVHIDFFAYQNEGAGVSAGVRGVQFFRHGKRLQSGLVSSASEFGLTSEIDAPAPGAPATGGDSLM